MALRKCPRCELNYIKDDETICNVCRRSAKGEPDDLEQGMCVECGEHPAIKGLELCAYCRREQRRRENLESLIDKPVKIEIEIEQFDEIDVSLPTDMPSEELDELKSAFGDEDEEDEEDEAEIQAEFQPV